MNHQNLSASASVYANTYPNYISLQRTHEMMHGYGVLRISQDEARSTGFEIEGKDNLFQTPRHHLSLHVWSDYTITEMVETGESLPLSPPLNIGGELSHRTGGFTLRGEVISLSEQTRVSGAELPTDGYVTMVASADYRFMTGNVFHMVSLQGRNLGT